MNKLTTRSAHLGLVTLFTVTFLCASVFKAHGHSLNRDDSHTREVLEKVLSSLESILDFFGRDFSAINLDGLFGIRLGQGSVNQTLTECLDPTSNCPQQLVQRLERLNSYTDLVVQRAMPYVEEQDPKYFRHFYPTLDGPYILEYHTEVLEQIPGGSTGDQEYPEGKGDRCISNLMGSYEGQPKCSITDGCWRFMTSENTMGYKITHQLLYFIFADKNGCIPEVNNRLKTVGKDKNLREHETRLCTRILSEAQTEVQDGNVPILKQDLFLEQSVLCGVLGYQNFMTEEWVNMVLSWQNSEGCFYMPMALTSVEDTIERLQNEERKLLFLMKQEAEAIERSPVTGRKLLREQLMDGDCLSHKTGLGFSLVSAYARHYVRLLYIPPESSH